MEPLLSRIFSVTLEATLAAVDATVWGLKWSLELNQNPILYAICQSKLRLGWRNLSHTVKYINFIIMTYGYFVAKGAQLRFLI